LAISILNGLKVLHDSKKYHLNLNENSVFITNDGKYKLDCVGSSALRTETVLGKVYVPEVSSGQRLKNNIGCGIYFFVALILPPTFFCLDVFFIKP
jgi:hypothetical protein